MQTVAIERDGGVATVYLNRPQQRNAYSDQMAYELDFAFIACDEDPKVKVIVLAGKGTHFCVGADLKGG